MESCCLCKVSVSSGQEKKRRKKLYGPSCHAARDVLVAELDLAHSLQLEDFVETKEKNSYLCKNCDAKLTTIYELQNRLSLLKGEVDGYLKAFRPRLTATTIAGKKRSLPYMSATTTPKRTCLDPPGTSQSSSPAVSVRIDYSSGPQVFAIHTPSRKAGIKQYTRRSFKSLASNVVTSPVTSDKVLREIANNITQEMNGLARVEHDSILRDNIEAVKCFSWETMYFELESKVPTLMKLLRLLVKKKRNSKPLIACVASQLLKDGHPKLGLMQRAMSIFLYGNGSNKQVYTSLNHLNICMSHSGTLKTLKTLCIDHDIEVQYWSDSLKACLLEKKESSVLPATSPQALLTSSDSDHEITSFSPISDWEETASTSVESSKSSRETGTEESPEPCSDPDLHPDLIPDPDPHPDPIPDPDPHSSVIGQHIDQLSPQPTIPQWNGFKIVGDNIDKNIRPSFQRLTHQTNSLHYFHSYAVKDRVNFSEKSDLSSAQATVSSSSFLMTVKEWDWFKEDCYVLVSRILVKHVDKFKDCAKEVEWHIPSKYTTEMAQKSEVIPLGVQLHNENRLNEMAKILEEFHDQYVPSKPSQETLTLGDGTTRLIDATQFVKVLMGGDQLTVARVRGTCALRTTHDTPLERLSGIIPVIEDWHARLTFMKVIWHRLFNTSSTSERGTMYQLRNLINRSGVSSNPEKNMKAAEDFLLLLLHAHVVAGARKIFEYESGFEHVGEVAKSIVNTHLLLPSSPATEDRVNTYARELMTLGLIWHEFHDAVKEGDGDRILLSWKIMIPIFKATNHTNYLKEGVNLLVQSKVFSERKAGQLLWSRCVNTQGRVGCNLPCDLHQEHLNRRLKTVLRSLGANLTTKAIVRAGKSLAVVHKICHLFESQTASTSAGVSGVHSTPAFGKDFKKILALLVEENILEPKSQRCHRTFKFRKGLLQMSADAKNEFEKKIESLINTLLAA